MKCPVEWGLVHQHFLLTDGGQLQCGPRGCYLLGVILGKVNRSHHVSAHGAEETQWSCIPCYLLCPGSTWKQLWSIDALWLVTLEEDMFYSVCGSAPTQTIPMESHLITGPTWPRLQNIIGIFVKVLGWLITLVQQQLMPEADLFVVRRDSGRCIICPRRRLQSFQIVGGGRRLWAGCCRMDSTGQSSTSPNTIFPLCHCTWSFWPSQPCC